MKQSDMPPFPPEGPDAALLMDYLDGAVSPTVRSAIERWLAAHPEQAAELADLAETRQWLHAQPPVPLPAGPVVLTAPAPRPARRWRLPLQVAAALLLLTLAAGLGGLRLSTGQGELRIGFGPPPAAAPAPAGLTEATLQAALAQQRDSLYLVLSRLEAQWQQQPPPAPVPAPAVARLDPAQLEDLRASILAENTRRMAELLTVSQAYQQEATEDLLRQFSAYLQQQRSQDLELISLALNDIVETSGRQQQETTWLLSELLAQLQAP